MTWQAACAALLVLSLAACHAAEDTAPIQRFDTAEVTLHPDGSPPAPPRTVSLRHRWDSASPGVSGEALYRIALPALPAGTDHALWLEAVGNQAAVRVNGTLVRQLGRPRSPFDDAGKFGHLVPLPAALLHTDRPNLLQLDVTAQALRGGGLSPVGLGPLAAAEAERASRLQRDQYAAAAYGTSMLLMGGLSLGLWWRQRVPLYGCFVTAVLLGSLRQFDRLLPTAPLPWPVWGGLMAVSYGVQLALIARFVLLALDRQPRWLATVQRAVVWIVAVLAASSFALGRRWPWDGALWLLWAAGMVCFAVVLRSAFVERRAIAWVVLGAGSLLLATGLHDLITVRSAHATGLGFPLTPHALFFFLLILAGLVVERYSRTEREHKALNEELVHRVAERERQLGEAFEALRRQKEEQAVLKERQRIMREIHDGVGSQLVGLLNLVTHRDTDPEQLTEHVQMALDEMRLAVDSLQPVHSDLATVLATLRYRLQPRLKAAGIEVLWDVDRLPPLPQLSPESVLQVQRILLEAFTNVLKHARATQVVMHAHCSDGAAPVIELRLSDNGVGLAPSDPSPNPGRGVANMRTRAEAIGARLWLEPGAGRGAAVVLEWPVGTA